MPDVITTCAKCSYRYKYFFDGRNYMPCPNCGYDRFGSLKRASTTELIAQLRSSDWITRNNAAVMLGERGVQEAVGPLLAMLRSDGAEVVDGVIIALGHLREERAIENLISLLFEGRDWRKEQQTEGHAETKQYPGRIIDALLRIGTERAVEAVTATNPYVYLSVGNLRALGQFGEKVVPTLAKVALSSGDEDKQKAAIASLAEVRGELAVSTLKKKLESPRKGVVLATHNALVEIGYKPVDEVERVMLILAGDNWQELNAVGDSAVPVLVSLLMSSPSRVMRRCSISVATMVLDADRRSAESCILSCSGSVGSVGGHR